MELSQQYKQKFMHYYKKWRLTFGCCDLCGNHCQHYALLCQACFHDLPRFHLDKVQADLLNWPAIHHALPKSHFDHLVCLSPYLAPFQQWLMQFKYHGRFELAPFFAHLLADQFKRYWSPSTLNNLPVELILSVPLHISKWQIRGYNQAHLLAKYFAEHMQLPYQSNGLVRHKLSVSQVGQSGSNRRKNLKNAFEVMLSEEQLPAHVLLVDDVVTTGATTSEIAKILKQAGVKKVTVAALCLSLPS